LRRSTTHSTASSPTTTFKMAPKKSTKTADSINAKLALTIKVSCAQHTQCRAGF
jgi:hypothetical protein